MATKRLKRPRDPIQLGKLIVDIATGQVEDKVETKSTTRGLSWTPKMRQLAKVEPCP